MDQLISLQDLTTILVEIREGDYDITITKDSKLFEDLGVTSFDLLVAINEIENKYGITIPIKTDYAIETVNDLLTYINSISR
jgi:phosphopantetheine attachment domain protein